MEQVRAALRSMISPNAGIGVTDPTVASELWPEEAAVVSHAIPRRQTEFAAGRRAARSAMAELGVSPIAVPQGSDRAPVWPVGISGSISHCAQCCIAVAARGTEYQSLGVDIEPNVPLEPDLIPVICTPTEQAWVMSQPSAGLAAKRVFSVKEAVYKAQYPLTGKVIGFDAVTVEVANGSFKIAPNPDLPNLKGAILIIDGLILSLAYV